MALGREVGFTVPATALVAMPDGMLPALLVERFDIRESNDDHRLLAMEDLCSVLALPPESKYDGTIERIARAVRALSTAPEEDVLLVLKRALFAWLIGDGDMHLKNMALLKITQAGQTTFSSVRLAPLYDAVTTRVFPHLDDRMALRLNGRNSKLRRADFLALAATADLRASDAEASIDEVLKRLHAATSAIKLPTLPGLNAEGEAMVEKMLALCKRPAKAC